MPELQKYIVYIPRGYTRFFDNNQTIFFEGTSPESATQKLADIWWRTFGIPEEDRNEFIANVNLVPVEEGVTTSHLNPIPEWEDVFKTEYELRPHDITQIPLDLYRTAGIDPNLRAPDVGEGEEDTVLDPTSYAGLLTLAPQIGVQDLVTADVVSRYFLAGLPVELGIDQEGALFESLSQSVDYLVHFWMYSNPGKGVEDARNSAELQEGVLAFIQYGQSFEITRLYNAKLDSLVAEEQLEPGLDNSADITTANTILELQEARKDELDRTYAAVDWWQAGAAIAFIPDVFTDLGGDADPFGKPEFADVGKFLTEKEFFISELREAYADTESLSTADYLSLMDMVDENFPDWYEEWGKVHNSGQTTDSAYYWILQNQSNEKVREFFERRGGTITFDRGVLADLYQERYGDKAAWTRGNSLSFEVDVHIQNILLQAFNHRWNQNRDEYPNKDDFWNSLPVEEMDAWVNSSLRQTIQNSYGEAGIAFLEDIKRRGLTVFDLMKSWGDRLPDVHGEPYAPLLNFDPTQEGLSLNDFFIALRTYSEVDPGITSLVGEVEPETIAEISFLRSMLAQTLTDLPTWLGDELVALSQDQLRRVLSTREDHRITEATSEDLWELMTAGETGITTEAHLIESILTTIKQLPVERAGEIIEFLENYDTGVVNGFNSLDINWDRANTIGGFALELEKYASEERFPTEEEEEILPELSGVLPSLIDYLPESMKIQSVGLAREFFELEWGFQSLVGDERRLTREELAASPDFEARLNDHIERQLERSFRDPFTSLIIDYLPGGLRQFFDSFPAFGQMGQEEIDEQIRKTIFNPPEGDPARVAPQFLNTKIMNFIETQLRDSIAFKQEYDALLETAPETEAQLAEEEQEAREAEQEAEKEESEQEQAEREAKRERQMLADVQIAGRSVAEQQFQERFRSVFGAVVGPQLAFDIEQDSLAGFQTEFLEGFEDFKGFLSPDQYVAITGEDFEPQATRDQFDLAKSKIGEAQAAYFQQFDPDRILSLTRQTQIGQTRFDAPVARRQRRQFYRSPRTPQVPAGF